MATKTVGYALIDVEMIVPKVLQVSHQKHLLNYKGDNKHIKIARLVVDKW
jgi:hypothetical protein